MKDVLYIIFSSYEDFFSVSGFGGMFAACLLFLLLGRKKKIGYAMLWPCLLLLGGIFCPLTADIIMKMIGGEVYWRVFWLLPVVLIVAFTGTEIVALVKGRGKKILLTLLCITLIAVNGEFVFTDEYFENRENNYKIPTEVIWVADAINEHAQENEIKKKKIVAPISISTYIRIYDATILQAYGRDMSRKENPTQLYTEIHAEEHDFEHLGEQARAAKCRYVILEQESDDKEAMEAQNFKQIYESTSYTVYFNLKYQKKKH